MRRPDHGLDEHRAAVPAAHPPRRVLKLAPQPSQSQMSPPACRQSVVARTSPIALSTARPATARPDLHDQHVILETNTDDEQTADTDEPTHYSGDGACKRKGIAHPPCTNPAPGAKLDRATQQGGVSTVLALDGVPSANPSCARNLGRGSAAATAESTS